MQEKSIIPSCIPYIRSFLLCLDMHFPVACPIIRVEHFFYIFFGYNINNVYFRGG